MLNWPKIFNSIVFKQSVRHTLAFKV